MTATEQTIQDAIEGGWNVGEGFEVSGRGEKVKVYTNNEDDDKYIIDINQILLDPKFWEAVGTTRSWSNREENKQYVWVWKHHWHTFIDHLADGKTIEEALSLL